MDPPRKKVEDIFGLEGQTLDEYDVERAVAAGGFGVVYRATSRELGHTVALKVLKIPSQFSAADREEFEQKFKDEARTIANLNHPAIVKVLRYKVSPLPANGTAPWMALEWVDGDTLAEVLRARRGGGLPPEACLCLLEPVFSALAHAHGKGVVHRDIKPANLMIPRTAKDESGRASSIGVGLGSLTRVLDFGIAKIEDPDTHVETGETDTMSRLRAVSLPYASPEQISGKRTGPWTDVHALALVLTEMLTAHAPYQTTDRDALLFRILNPERPTPARLGVDVGAWEPVLARALSLKTQARFANVLEFYKALKDALPDARPALTTEAGPPTLPESAPRADVVDTLPESRPRASTTSPLTADPSAPRPGSATVLRAVAVLLVLFAGAGFWIMGGLGDPSPTRLVVLPHDGGPPSDREPSPRVSSVVLDGAVEATVRVVADAGIPPRSVTTTDGGLLSVPPPTHSIRPARPPRRRRRPID